jgi:ubiquinone/menaquinone biosynthesis C-methylase UbiE
MAIEPQMLQQLMFAYIKSGLLKAAVDLELFTHIARGHRTAAEVASAAGADRRAVSIVLDALTAQGLLEKQGEAYGLDPVVEALLVVDSPAYAGAFTRVTLNPRLWKAIGGLTDIVRSGRPPETMVDEPDHEFWTEFSASSEKLSQIGGNAVADALQLDADAPAMLLDVAAGSGVYGFTALERYPQARLTSLDWPNVLAHARTIAERRGVADRVTWLSGSAFDTPLPEKHFDAIIMSHFLHHFSAEQNTALAGRLFDALRPGGQLVVHEFIPDEARAAHEPALLFAVVMLASTERGNVYTFAEYSHMLNVAGFEDFSLTPVPMGGSSILSARRPPA